jgi:hypothetical protein
MFQFKLTSFIKHESFTTQTFIGSTLEFERMAAQNQGELEQ